MEKLTVRPCLICNRDTVIVEKDWAGEAPVAFCYPCCGLIASWRIPWPLVKLLHSLRCGQRALQVEVDLVKQDIRRLYTAQQEIEQDYLQLHS